MIKIEQRANGDTDVLWVDGDRSIGDDLIAYMTARGTIHYYGRNTQDRHDWPYANMPRRRFIALAKLMGENL